VKALASVGNRIDLALSSGTRSEIRNNSSVLPTGSWSGPDGVSHPIADWNLVADPGWFPTFTLASFAASPSALVTYVGQETKNDLSVIHLSALQQYLDRPPKVAVQMQRLSQVQIFLDASTLLPVALVFNTHADDNSNLDISVEMDFSDYHSVNGVQIPFHVQKLLNNGLFLDVQFENAVLNTGVSASSFTAQ